jgi:hypothetical protein
VEKRAYVLSPRPSRRAVIAASVWFAAAAGVALWLLYHGHGHRTWLAIILPMLVWGWWSSVFPRGSKLEISDDGLFLTLRRGVGYMLRWSAITSVRIHEQSAAARFWSAIIEDSNGHVVKIPRKSQDKAEIIEILKQHLPESAFQVW